jgi:hypothetical protein
VEPVSCPPRGLSWTQRQDTHGRRIPKGKKRKQMASSQKTGEMEKKKTKEN